LVKNTVGPNGFRIGIPKQGVFDLVPLGKELQNFLRIVADGGQLDSLFLESRDSILQLNQLPFTEWSPVGGAEEKNDGALRSPQGFKSLNLRELVAKRKCGGLLAYGETNGHGLNRSDLN
jgi:hypothetical protein